MVTLRTVISLTSRISVQFRLCVFMFRYFLTCLCFSLTSKWFLFGIFLAESNDPLKAFVLLWELSSPCCFEFCHGASRRAFPLSSARSPWLRRTSWRAPRHGSSCQASSFSQTAQVKSTQRIYIYSESSFVSQTMQWANHGRHCKRRQVKLTVLLESILVHLSDSCHFSTENGSKV